MRRLGQCLAIFLVGSGFALGEQGDATNSDFPVYNAVLALMQFPKPRPRIVINEKTLNSGCGESSRNTVLMNGCGIFGQGSTASEVGDDLQQSMPELDRAIWAHFTGQVTTSINLPDKFLSPWPHAVVDLNAPLADPWKSPDGVILLSRIGYNPDHTKALVYVLFLSYMQEVPTSGNFFLFQRTGKEPWQPVGRTTYIETTK